MTCICGDPDLAIDVYLYGCPEEICPGCYMHKRHDDALCVHCSRYQRWYWRMVWRPYWRFHVWKAHR